MIVLCSNDSSKSFHTMSRQYPNRLGWLMGPSSWKNPRAHLPYALDNDAFIAWKRSTPFDTTAWLRMIDKAVSQEIKPMWALVPDVVADRERTLEEWSKYWGVVYDAGFKPAFAVQDGMTAYDVPCLAMKDFTVPVIFVGGTTSWKWRTAREWCQKFPRVHIGRTNGLEKLWTAQRLGAESCDGSGYFRATANGLEARKLLAWLHHRTNPQFELTL